MKLMLRALALAGAFMLALSPAPAQQLPSGHIVGNSSAGSALARPDSLTNYLDRAFGATTNRGIFRDTSSWTTFAITAYARTLLDDADATAGRATLGLSIGSAVEAWDADLDCIAALATTGIVRRTGSGTCSAGTAIAAAEIGALTSAELAAIISNETGSGLLVFATAPTLSGTVDLSGTVKLSSFVTSTQIAANQNNYTATDGSNTCSTKQTLRISSDASRNVTGLSCGQAEGDVRLIHNVGAQDVVLTNQDAASTAGNRFLFGGDVTLLANYSITVRYDGVTSRWRAITTATAGGGGGGTVTSAVIAAGTGISVGGTCTITTTGTCTVSTSGVPVLVASGNQNSGANLDLVLTSLTSYKGIKVFLYNCVPATDAVQLFVRVSTDGGSTFDSSASNYRYAGTSIASDAGTTVSGFSSNAATEIAIVAGGVSNTAANGINLELTLFGQTAASRTKLAWSANEIDDSGRTRAVTGAGMRDAAQDTDAIRFLWGSGSNFSSCPYAVFAY